MIYNEPLAQRIREALAAITMLEEKIMFSGLCFMVNGKMCICVNNTEMMCRIGLANFETAVEMNGCRPMVHNGKTMKGFIFVSEAAITTKTAFNYWINMALEFNKIAKPSRSKKKK